LHVLSQDIVGTEVLQAGSDSVEVRT
jgi:hypothetical protein